MSLYWINATLSGVALAHVRGLTMAREVWLALERHFALQSESHIIQIKTQLQSIKKGPMTITENLQKIKHTSYSLASSVSSRR